MASLYREKRRAKYMRALGLWEQTEEGLNAFLPGLNAFLPVNSSFCIVISSDCNLRVDTIKPFDEAEPRIMGSTSSKASRAIAFPT